jgi:hypothetical protein
MSTENGTLTFGSVRETAQRAVWRGVARTVSAEAEASPDPWWEDARLALATLERPEVKE